MSLSNSTKGMEGKKFLTKKPCSKCNNQRHIETRNFSKCTKCGHITRY